MSAAAARKQPQPTTPERTEVITFPGRDGGVRPDVMEEARLGAERLARMSHDEVRNEISKRVQMLDTVLKEREERRAAIEEALVAQRVLDLRRARARRIRRRVNIGSSLVAAMFTGLVVVGMF